MTDPTNFPDLSFPNNGYIPEAIPDGDHYEVVFVRAEKIPQWGREKIILWFQLMTVGEWLGKEFFMACNLPPKGKWTPSCKFWRAYVMANGGRPHRRDRFSTSVFRHKLFRVKIRRVTRDSKQHVLAPAQQYSVVDTVLEVVTGGKFS